MNVACGWERGALSSKSSAVRLRRSAMRASAPACSKIKIAHELPAPAAACSLAVHVLRVDRVQQRRDAQRRLERVTRKIVQRRGQ